MLPKQLLVPSWMWLETKTCNRFLFGISPDGDVDVDGGHTDPEGVAKALALRQAIRVINPEPGTRYVMVTIEEVPEYAGTLNNDAIDTLNNMSD